MQKLQVRFESLLHTVFYVGHTVYNNSFPVLKRIFRSKIYTKSLESCVHSLHSGGNNPSDPQQRHTGRTMIKSPMFWYILCLTFLKELKYLVLTKCCKCSESSAANFVERSAKIRECNSKRQFRDVNPNFLWLV